MWGTYVRKRTKYEVPMCKPVARWLCTDNVNNGQSMIVQALRLINQMSQKATVY